MTQPRRTVLVVEDDRDINQLVGEYVMEAGFRYLSSPDGMSVFEKARSGKPSLILLDLMLPDLNGFEVCRRLKEEPSTQGIPVVFLTALDQKKFRDRARDCGAVDYLLKPFAPEVLIDTIHRHASPQA
jgi:DNA-binding response OmpR family regulator